MHRQLFRGSQSLLLITFMIGLRTKMHKTHRTKIADLNEQLTCVLCKGYLIDATTIIECLHAFCRKCIVKYLETNKYCPICEVQVHKNKPLLNIRSDQTLQDIVYKLVPGLFKNEMCRRREFYAKHFDQKPAGAEETGDVTQITNIYTPEESISLSLEYYNNNVPFDYDNNAEFEFTAEGHSTRRFLRCPAAVSVGHLQKLIRAKYGLSTQHRVDILYKNDRLSEDFTLMDIAYVYFWRRKVPMHLTYRIFEIAKRIKINDELLSTQGMQQYDLDNDVEMKNEWKEVQLQISENGVMSVTNIAEAKVPENGASLLDVKPELDLSVDNIPELSPIIQKTEKCEKVEKMENLEITEVVIKKEEEAAKVKPEVEVPVTTISTVSTVATISTDLKLGKHKLPEETINETNPKIMKINPPVNKPSLIKNVQQLSRNHPLKIHSQTTQPPKTNFNPAIVLNNILKTPKITQQHNKNNVNNNNASDKPVPNNSVVQNAPNILPTTTTTKMSTTLTTTTNMTNPQGPKYTQAGQSTDNTRVTKSNDSAQLRINNQTKTPISCSILPTVNTIQSSKVGIVPKKTPAKPTMIYKTLRDPPKVWNPQIPRQTFSKNSLYSNNGASTSDPTKRVDAKPAKFFKMRNNMPRYLGNPASGVKPMYQVREGDKSPTDPKDLKKLDSKINNNDIVKDLKYKSTTEISVPSEPKAKIDLKKSIIKIDPKTLRPITDSSPSCSDTPTTEVMKINQSTVPIFNPLRTQKNQTSPKIDRRSPKTSTASSSSSTNFLDPPKPPKSPLEQRNNSPKSSPTAKKEKLNLNFTPPNPFIPNLSSPNIAPIFFSWFPSYNPAAALNNNFPPFHPLNMYNSEHMYPGRSAQDLISMPPNLMSEAHKNRRKFYDNPAILPLSPNMESTKKPATCVKDNNKSTTNTSEDKSKEKTNTAVALKTVKTAKIENKETIKNNSSSSVSNKETRIEKSTTNKAKIDSETSKKEETVDISNAEYKNKDNKPAPTKPKEKEEQNKKEDVITKEVIQTKDSIVPGPPKTT